MTLFLAAASVAAQVPTLAIVEKVAGSVGFYTADGKRIAGAKAGAYPHEIVQSPDGRFLYVTDNGILWMTYAGQGGNTITVVDAKTRTNAGVIDLGEFRRPHGIDVDGKTGRLAVTIENPDGLLLIDPVSRKVIRKYDTQGEDPHMVLFGPGGEYVYVSNTTTNTVAAIHLASGRVKLIPVGKRPQGGVFTRDGHTLYLTNSEDNTISIIDTGRNEGTGLIKTSGGAARVAITPDGRTLVFNITDPPGIGFADVASGKETGKLSLSGRPMSLTLSLDGSLAYTGIQEENKVVAVSIADRKIAREFTTPKDAGPDPVLPLR